MFKWIDEWSRADSYALAVITFISGSLDLGLYYFYCRGIFRSHVIQFAAIVSYPCKHCELMFYIQLYDNHVTSQIDHAYPIYILNLWFLGDYIKEYKVRNPFFWWRPGFIKIQVLYLYNNF